jgi:Ca2+-binding RTX toxin-like protein
MNIHSKTGLCAAALLGVFSAAGAEGTSPPDDVVTVGPVELVESGHLTVLGRIYETEDMAGLTAGDKVAVHGALQPDGSVKNVWIEPLGSYQAGADPVFETGIVTKVNDVFGRMSVGGSEVDYTAALAEPGASAPTVGEMVVVYGIQPEAGGIVLGATTHAQPQAVTMAMGVAGARRASIQGGATAMSIQGGAMAQSIQGGAMAQSIQGGAMAQSIQGGAMAQSIQGGAKAQSIQGGAKAQSIQGGAKAQSIQGGAKAQSIQGGAKAQSIQGGAMAQSIQGGAKAQSIQGGATAMSIQGGAVASR